MPRVPIGRTWYPPFDYKLVYLKGKPYRYHLKEKIKSIQNAIRYFERRLEEVPHIVWYREHLAELRLTLNCYEKQAIILLA